MPEVVQGGGKRSTSDKVAPVCLLLLVYDVHVPPRYTTISMVVVVSGEILV
jgi:hypothetical protein